MQGGPPDAETSHARTAPFFEVAENEQDVGEVVEVVEVVEVTPLVDDEETEPGSTLRTAGLDVGINAEDAAKDSEWLEPVAVGTPVEVSHQVRAQPGEKIGDPAPSIFSSSTPCRAIQV